MLWWMCTSCGHGLCTLERIEAAFKPSRPRYPTWPFILRLLKKTDPHIEMPA